MHGVACGSWVLARCGSITYVVSVYVLPEIGIPRLKTDSEVAVTALSEGFSPLAVLTLRLESLPYQRADTRHSRFYWCQWGFLGCRVLRGLVSAFVVVAGGVLVVMAVTAGSTMFTGSIGSV